MMNKFDTAILRYKKAFAEKLNRNDVDEHLLRSIASYLGPSIYKSDGSKVACSKAKERNAIKTSFLIKKLGLRDSPELDAAIKEVCQTMGSSNTNKYRAVFYYLLVEKFEKQEIFAITNSTIKPESAAVGVIDSEPHEERQNSTESTNDSSESNNTGLNMTPEMIIERHALYAAGAGLVPIPLIDLVSISAVQFKMIKKLASQYDHVSFDTTKAQSLIAAFMGGVSSFEVGILSRILFKGIPIFGLLIGGAATSGFAYYSTRVIGDLFNEHFSSGGDMTVEERTILKMKQHFNFELGRKKSAL